MATTLAPENARLQTGSSLPSQLSMGAAAVVLLTGIGYGGWAAIKSWSTPAAPTSRLVHKVSRGELLNTVSDDGNLESAANIDLKCQVAGGTSILKIVADGKEVKEGDKLVELDGSKIDELINQQKITIEKARATMIQADKDFEVAKIAVAEYEEGVYKKEIQDQDAQITIALENLRGAQNALDHSQRMFRKGYISSLELEGQQFAVQRANLELASAKTAKDVLERFTKAKMLQDLISKRDTAEAKLKSEQSSFQLEETRLKKLEDQLKLCVINAPQDGMVVYANESSSRYRSSSSVTIEEGASVREQQTIIRLPDLSRMQARVNVHEARVERLRPGMRARIRILDRELQGTVTQIANQPESTSWFSAAVKTYATIVKIDGEPHGLKPGMTSSVEILVAHLKDVLTLPVATVVEQRGEFFCWVDKGDGSKPERRKLLLGDTNDSVIEVKDGVAEGEVVLLNPRAVVPEAREDVGQADVDVKKRFGEGKALEATPEKTSGSKGPSSGGGPSGGGNRNLMSFDKNGDGKVSKEEAPEGMRSFFDRIDTNGDGVLDAAEIKASADRRRAAGGDGARPPM